MSEFSMIASFIAPLFDVHYCSSSRLVPPSCDSSLDSVHPSRAYLAVGGRKLRRRCRIREAESQTGVLLRQHNAPTLRTLLARRGEGEAKPLDEPSQQVIAWSWRPLRFDPAKHTTSPCVRLCTHLDDRMAIARSKGQAWLL
ncbi:uncharacterized protein LAESUDRAFT_433005 [Laetiporus sulphureus 93-53]|uniref:Uncharacterized protein n=1 Tax=Laetiporus sulphureus 93-53 TaxID=1314785 RepID=A0A165C5N9_9APHY|nr:uncharacterized protein LAESUDRAFT_433005 [Laetiporus sulphureus 93-53]KZT02249.1 hypothetical protein LAESUDRAFT_433005 [Laetiporus sulphureus 93-53]